MLFSAHVLGVQMVRWLGIGASSSLAQYIICIYLGKFALCYVVFVDVFCTCFSLNDLYLVCCLCTYIFVWFIVYWTDLLVLLLLFATRPHVEAGIVSFAIKTFQTFQSSASLAFVCGIHRGPMSSPHKWPVTRRMFPWRNHVLLMFFADDLSPIWH